MPRHSRGVVLFVALIVLVALSMAGIALMRSLGTGVLVASNLAFKQTTTAGAERGVEAARAWLLAQTSAALDSDNAGAGYYSSWGSFDPATHNWNSGTAALAADAAGTALQYVVHRLCQTPNASVNASGQQCVLKSIGAGVESGGSHGGVAYGSFNLATKISPYYRITVRSQGPKRSVSYVQVIID